MASPCATADATLWLALMRLSTSCSDPGDDCRATPTRPIPAGGGADAENGGAGGDGGAVGQAGTPNDGSNSDAGAGSMPGGGMADAAGTEP
jgi:hypothetical protein